MPAAMRSLEYRRTKLLVDGGWSRQARWTHARLTALHCESTLLCLDWIADSKTDSSRLSAYHWTAQFSRCLAGSHSRRRRNTLNTLVSHDCRDQSVYAADPGLADCVIRFAQLTPLHVLTRKSSSDSGRAQLLMMTKGWDMPTKQRTNSLPPFSFILFTQYHRQQNKYVKTARHEARTYTCLNSQRQKVK